MYEEFDSDIPANGTSAFLIESWIEPQDLSIKSLWEWNDPDEVPLRIALCGAAGTGKDALATKLAKELDIAVIKDIVRTANRLGAKINKNADWSDELMILVAHLWEHYEYSEFIAASSLIDLVAHCHYVAEKNGTRKDKLILRGLANIVNAYSQNEYSVVLYVPLENKPRGDGVRSVDMKYLKQIDSLTRYYLNAFDLDYFPVQGDTVSDRLKLSIDYMREFGLLSGR